MKRLGLTYGNTSLTHERFQSLRLVRVAGPVGAIRVGSTAIRVLFGGSLDAAQA